MRLIDADALLLEIEEELANKSHFFTHEQNEMIDCGLRIALHDIMHQPTVGAVEVVRCEECKHLTADGLCWEKIRGSVGYKETSLDDFCSYGERHRND